ncbi:LysE/ArgO family amino acid transporter [Allorhizobium taibaishanense]|uniref:Amino acid transporter n=1 Tax=Allorhizobium taibaishanense TaxID=887144 RepID=A0A1Q9A5N0_9HYPH|nr:LysE/ArgO family amino acid transporter [Allorhizobium taibaishanense]MBB4006254.1 L-lysine exporter family protein LysE/ArgO [Allorhizobium taibaishanense]OLP49845.1 amino acid transporter [Allorhizobium taibaishanense]
MQNAFLSGLGLGLSLIIAIGAQNAFLLRQGLRREHVFLMSLTCALSDALLIALGVTSLARVTAIMPAVEPVLRYGGAAFLMLYGARHAYAALKTESGLTPTEAPPSPLAASLATCLALTFLNPHVYLDTVLLVGSVSSRYGEHRNAFGVGAMTASFVFFFSLGYGARLLAPIFARPFSWRCLDAIIAVVMVWIGIGLIRG